MANRKTESVEKLVKKAFTDLLQRKYYMDITVSDIVKESGIARASFYRNFASTNDVLNKIVDDTTISINETLIPVFHSDDESLWREFLFNYVYDFRSRQKKLITNYPANVSVILFRINDRISQLQEDQSLSDIHEKYRSSARFGLIYMVLKRWVDSGMDESPEELINYLMESITHI